MLPIRSNNKEQRGILFLLGHLTLRLRYAFPPLGTLTRCPPSRITFRVGHIRSRLHLKSSLCPLVAHFFAFFLFF